MIVQHWISVTEKLPNNGQRVLCYEDYRPLPTRSMYHGCDIYYYRIGIGFVFLETDEDPQGGITHWMPLPIDPTEFLNGS